MKDRMYLIRFFDWITKRRYCWAKLVGWHIGWLKWEDVSRCDYCGNEYTYCGKEKGDA